MNVEPTPDANYYAQSIFELLRRFRWQPSPRPVEQPYEIWTNPDFQSDILIPVDPHKADFNQLLDRAYKMLVHETRLLSLWRVRRSCKAVSW